MTARLNKTYATPHHHRDLHRVVHRHHYNGGAWCCSDLGASYLSPTIPPNVPVTCLWCLAGCYAYPWFA